VSSKRFCDDCDCHQISGRDLPSLALSHLSAAVASISCLPLWLIPVTSMPEAARICIAALGTQLQMLKLHSGVRPTDQGWHFPKLFIATIIRLFGQARLYLAWLEFVATSAHRRHAALGQPDFLSSKEGNIKELSTAQGGSWLESFASICLARAASLTRTAGLLFSLPYATVHLSLFAWLSSVHLMNSIDILLAWNELDF